MKKRFQGFIIGLIVGATLISGFAYAKEGAELVERIYNNIKITLNGQEIIPKDVNGNPVEPFIIDGTTYLPVRAVGNALNLNVDWDGNTNTVILTDSSYVPEGEYPEPEYIDGDIIPLYVNPVFENVDGKLMVTSYDKKFEKSFFLKKYGEFSNMGNYFIKLDSLYDIYPDNKTELQSKLSNMEVNSYEGKPYAMLVNIIQYFRQRNIEFDIHYNDDFAYIKFD